MNLRHFPTFHLLWNQIRSAHTVCESTRRPVQSIYVSKSTNPYFNLSLEDWLFRAKNQQEPLLLLYRDEPCVVIGRNQNPWKEVNLQLADTASIPFIRRRSGGGTVYHDTGNTNYSIHVPRSSFDRKHTASIIVRAVRSLGIDAEVNDRNDICVSGYKISSAYKIVNSRAYHHGTMLISTELSTLGDLLHTSKETLITKGVTSVRSPVRNLQEFDPSITHDHIVTAVISSFQSEFGINEEPNYVEEGHKGLDNKAIRGGMDELQTWDWQYGQTPEFTYKFSRAFEWGLVTAEIVSKHGVISSCKIDYLNSDTKALRILEQQMEGQKYGSLNDLDLDTSVDHSHGNDALLRELWHWVCEETRY